jgi:hypothetical protein
LVARQPDALQRMTCRLTAKTSGSAQLAFEQQS